MSVNYLNFIIFILYYLNIMLFLYFISSLPCYIFILYHFTHIPGVIDLMVCRSLEFELECQSKQKKPVKYAYKVEKLPEEIIAEDCKAKVRLLYDYRSSIGGQRIHLGDSYISAVKLFYKGL